MNKNLEIPRARGYGFVFLAGSWAPNGAAAIDPTQSVNADWFTIGYSGTTGLYTLTLTNKYLNILSYNMTVQSVPGTLYRADLIVPSNTSLQSLVSTMTAIPFQLSTTAGTVVSPGANAASRVFMEFIMQNSAGK